MMSMYNVPTDGCNLEIMGYPFYAEEVSPTEAFRRREYNVNNLVGGTQKITKGSYVGLEFSITTHVDVDPYHPEEHNTIFQEMMSKPVRVVSPEIGGSFTATVVIKPEHETPEKLKLTITIKEVPTSKSRIPGESFVVPKARVITVKKNRKNKNTSSSSKSGKGKSKSKRKQSAKKNK